MNTQHIIHQQIQSASRWAWGSLVVVFVGSLLWASLLPLSEGVPTEAVVSIDSKRRTIQHSTGGIVSQVAVTEGQFVRQGDTLLAIDASISLANLETARQSVAALKQNLSAQQSLLKGLHQAERNRLEQIDISERELGSIRNLVAEGFASKVTQMQLERNLASLKTDLTDTRTNIQRTRFAILELGHQIQAAEQRLQAAQDENQRLVLTAPADGQVVGLQVYTAGAVVQAGQRLLDIVPQQEPLMLEAKIPPQYIDRIQVGQQVDARFATFANVPQLVAQAQLVSVSTDVLAEPNGGSTYYLARAQLTPQGLQALGGRQLQPGMSAEVVIHTGSRTLLAYMLAPLTRRLAAAMTED